MLSYNTKITSDNDDHIYHNISITNQTNLYLPASFTETRSTPVVSKADEYEISVIRFTAPCSDIPIFKFRDNKYIVSFRYEFAPNQFVNFERYVIFQQRDFVNILGVPFGNRYIYSYQRFIDMVNAALLTAFATFKAAYPAIPPTSAPFFQFESETRISLNFQQLFLNAPTIQIFINEDLFSFFQSFSSDAVMIIDPPSGNPLGQPDPASAPVPTGNQTYAYSITLADLGNNYSPSIFVPNSNHVVNWPGYSMFAEFPTLYAWNDVRGLTFLTYSIPVIGDIISNTESKNKDLTYKILTDFELNTELGPESRSNILYNPTAEYRMKDLHSTNEIRTTDISIFWTDRQGLLNELFIAPNDTITIKLMYRRKGWPNK